VKTLRQIWFIAVKDLKLFIADKMALFFALLFPFLFATMFYFLLGGAGSGDKRLELHIVTRETDGISNSIINSMVTRDPSILQPGEPLIIKEESYEIARQKVEAKKISGFMSFPEDFTEAINLGYGTRIEIVTDPQATNTRAALAGLARSIASQINARIVSNNATIGLIIEKEVASGNYSNLPSILGQAMSQISSPENQYQQQVAPLIDIETINVGEVEAENPANYVIPGYLVMFVFFTAALSAELIVRERQNHTMERLLACSVRREAILGGIYTGTTMKGVIQIILFWAVGIFVFKMDPGESIAGVTILSILTVLMSTSFSLMLATLVRSQRAASAIGVVTSLILAPLGGCWWPLFITPRWMQFLAQFTPHGWATTGFNKLMVSGADFNAAIPNMLVLLAFTAIFGITAVIRFRTSAT